MNVQNGSQKCINQEYQHRKKSAIVATDSSVLSLKQVRIHQLQGKLGLQCRCIRKGNIA